MDLKKIGFYTLSDNRCWNLSAQSDMYRGEILITGICNFKCPYCRGPREGAEGHQPLEDILTAIDYWTVDNLKNIRFSGGEPTTHPHLIKMVKYAELKGVERIAISTNGSATLEKYRSLVKAGVNDFSISLDACCASDGNKMAGTDAKWDRLVENIKWLSSVTYVTVGVVLTEENVAELKNIVRFAHDLGVDDIRIISAAQYNTLLEGVADIPQEILDAHPILKYRVDNIKKGNNVRGITDTDTSICFLPIDDSVIVGDKHYPCVIYMREGGDAIGDVGPNMRQERIAWNIFHNSKTDPICSKNCLDVCRDHNMKCAQYKEINF